MIKKKIVFIVSLILVFILGLLIGIFLFPKNEQIQSNEKAISNVDIKYINGEKYYIITDDYKGEYDYQEIKIPEDLEDSNNINDKIKSFNTSEILNYDQYYQFCKKWNLNQKYTDKNKNYMVVSYAYYQKSVAQARLANAIEDNGKITLYMWEKVGGVSNNTLGFFIVVPVSSNIYQKEINIAYTQKEYNNMVNGNYTRSVNNTQVKKPIIYIYPEKETKVTVRLLNPTLLTTSYPKYNDGWTVVAHPDGNLKELSTDRNYYGLYYESNKHNINMKKDGFIVKGQDIIKFLEEKLEILGLNQREINEFIIYWLPRLERNKYNYIRFETLEEINNYMPLYINPKPDTVIRVIMDYKPLNNKIHINEQRLIPQKRSGYSVVEWGGNEIE